MWFHVNFSGIFTTLTAREQPGPPARSSAPVSHCPSLGCFCWACTSPEQTVLWAVRWPWQCGCPHPHWWPGLLSSPPGRETSGRVPAVQTDCWRMTCSRCHCGCAGPWSRDCGPAQADCWSGKATWSLTCDPSASHAPWSPKSTPEWGRNRWDALLLN